MLFEDDSGDEEMPDDFGMESDESDEDLDDDPKGSDEEEDEKLENNLEEIEKVRVAAFCVILSPFLSVKKHLNPA